MNHVETVLLENVAKPDSLFVFPTDVAASRWADRLLQLRQQHNTDGNTIPMDKFIAWDTFKQHSVRSKVQSKKSIPSVLRKMFICALIRENAQRCANGEEPIFTSLIQTRWAQQADSFAGWLTEMLPQLGVWSRQTAGMPADNISGDDRDLLTLMTHYAQFLEKHDLFEPAWETPPFEDTGKQCFIFFPESLSDFSEYKELLAASSHVQTIFAGTDHQNGDVFFYTNSRNEITEAALYILALHKNQNVPWHSISVSIPDSEQYGPYVFREFANRNIPYIKQSGKPLSAYPAGQFFTAIADCVSQQYSFSALTALLLNRHLPWKDNDGIQNLIDFGIKNNCIRSWTEEKNGKETAVDVWEDAFAHPFGGFKTETRQLFTDLKWRIHAMRHADSFAAIRKHYFIFRECFFDMDQCLEETNLILSRCISELLYLIEIEKSFPHVQVPDPYAFFTGYLAEVNYLAQQAHSGVAILPYRTAAPAPFDCHIVMGASQHNLSAVFSSLAFLPKSKREKLGITEHDVSLAFINLHQCNSRLPAAFFCSEQTFSGYTIPHCALSARALSTRALTRQRYGDDTHYTEQFATDLYRMESELFTALHYPPPAEGIGALPILWELHQNQKYGFESWKQRRNHSAETDSALHLESNPLLQLIKRQFCSNAAYHHKISVSATSLKSYFQCPSKWIFERALQLENVEIETGLMTDFITGLVYHAVLHVFLDSLRETGKPIAMPIAGGNAQKPIPKLPEHYRELLAEKVTSVFASFPRLPESEKTVMSILTAHILRAEQSTFLARLEEFLGEFIAYFAGYRVIASEARYTVPKNNYFLKGDIDCILEDERMNLVIVDFKTKTKPALADCTGAEGLADFQLPLYVSLTQDTLKREVHTALFFSIIDAEPQVLFGVLQNSLHDSAVPKKEEDRIMRGSDRFLGIMNEFEKKAEQFAQEISTLPFLGIGAFSEQCLQCEYKRVCRTLYKICPGKNHGT